MNLAVQSSSHFNGSLTAILHARPRGVSAQYVYRSGAVTRAWATWQGKFTLPPFELDAAE